MKRYVRNDCKVCMHVFIYIVCLIAPVISYSQVNGFSAVHAKVDFSKPLRKWDGFGFNYVQAAQTVDYIKDPQDYGGFKLLNETKKKEIIDLVFGVDGLQPSLLKMFLDPLHQQTEGGEYDHRKTTESMLFFVKEGVAMSQKRGDKISVLTTLYSPPGYITKQKIIRGRDLDPQQMGNLVNYMVDWSRFLLKEEQIPLKYLSLHNEGESWLRWPKDGSNLFKDGESPGHDYNIFLDPKTLIEIAKKTRQALDKAGLNSVGVTTGENTNWYRFSNWGYADAFADDPKALKSLSLITSHGFYVGGIDAGRWFGPHSNTGVRLLREKKPGLNAWVTSTAWDIKSSVKSSAGDLQRFFIMDALFIREIHGNIYEATVNGIIPWAGIQAASQWDKPDPNPGCAIRVYDDGTYEIQKAYYYYKQVSRAGKPGMNVVRTSAMDSDISLIGFASNRTKNPDAIVVINTSDKPRDVIIQIIGSKASQFEAYRTTGRQVYEKRNTAAVGENSDNYHQIGMFNVMDSNFSYQAPAGSVTTFFAR